MRFFQMWKTMSARQRIQNIILYAIGVSIMPFGAVLTVNAHLGANGYDTLNFALSDYLGINISLAICFTAFVLLIISACLRRGFPRIGTFVSSFLIGIFTNLWKGLLAPFQGKTMFSSFVLLILGLIIIGAAVACYMISVFSTNPADDLVVALNERGLPIKTAKISLDAICVALTLFFGGDVGIGTIICTFGLGPVIDRFHTEILRILDVPDTKNTQALGADS